MSAAKHPAPAIRVLPDPERLGHLLVTLQANGGDVALQARLSHLQALQAAFLIEDDSVYLDSAMHVLSPDLAWCGSDCELRHPSGAWSCAMTGDEARHLAAMLRQRAVEQTDTRASVERISDWVSLTIETGVATITADLGIDDAAELLHCLTEDVSSDDAQAVRYCVGGELHGDGWRVYLSPEALDRLTADLVEALA